VLLGPFLLEKVGPNCPLGCDLRILPLHDIQSLEDLPCPKGWNVGEIPSAWIIIKMSRTYHVVQIE